MKQLQIISILILISMVNLALLAGPGSGGTGSGSVSCTSGGPGASTCEITYTVGGTGISCSVTCLAPFYACCNLGWNLDPKCTCKSGNSNPS